MKRLSIFITVLTAGFVFLITACDEEPRVTACKDKETGLLMSQEACDALNNERAKREELEKKAKEQNSTSKPQTSDKKKEVIIPLDYRVIDGVFENTKLRFKFPIPEGYIVEERPIPKDPVELIDVYYAIGYFMVKPKGQVGDQRSFMITVEDLKGDFGYELKPDGIPTIVPAEGGLSDEEIELLGGLKGYLYLSNALGFLDDPHITIYREDYIYYLRYTDDYGKKEVSQAIKDFASSFTVTK